MGVLEQHVAPEGERARLDRLACSLMTALPSRASARKAAKAGRLLVDGAACEASRFVYPGQLVALLEPLGRLPPVLELPLEVAWQDDHVAAVVKVPGVPVNGSRYRTIEHALPFNLEPSSAPEALRRARPVHRLDWGTGGLLLCAKTGTALAALGRIFEERRVQKRYRALAVGRLDGSGRVDVPLDGRAAVSRWAAVEHTRSLRPGWLTTVDLWPETGRTHQLRRHLAHLGAPVLGDRPYGLPGLTLLGKGLYLWAVALQLPHPITGAPLSLEVPEPAKFHSMRRREARRWLRWRGDG